MRDFFEWMLDTHDINDHYSEPFQLTWILCTAVSILSVIIIILIEMFSFLFTMGIINLEVVLNIIKYAFVASIPTFAIYGLLRFYQLYRRINHFNPRDHV